MQIKKSLPAFTLAEILVVISIITIIALSLSNINFNSLSNRQKVSIGSSKIISVFEEVRNNSLIGRGVGVNLETPTSWLLSIENNSSSGSITAQYNTGSLNIYNTWESQTPFSMTQIRCKNINGGASEIITNATITFVGDTMNIGGCSITKPMILEMDYGVGGIISSIRFNALSGVVETY